MEYYQWGQPVVLIPSVDRLLLDFLDEMNRLLSTFLDTGKLYANIDCLSYQIDTI